MSNLGLVAASSCAVLLAFGCNGPPVAPSTSLPPDDPSPAEVAISVEIQPKTVRVGDVMTQTYRLSAALDHIVDIWLEVTPPTGESYSFSFPFPAEQTTDVANTGTTSVDKLGDWAMRIMGERLPEGVVLGSPSHVTWSVVP